MDLEMFAEKSKQCEIGLGNSFTDDSERQHFVGRRQINLEQRRGAQEKGAQFKVALALAPTRFYKCSK